MRTNRLCIALAAACLAQAAVAARIRIVTTTTDLADLARAVAGDAAEVFSITTGREDPHALTAKPSFIVRARDADVWIRVGLELEIGWEPVILRDARNPAIREGAARHIDAAAHVTRLEVPSRRVTRDQGDVHSEGNPHVWLDPLNGRVMAATIAERLAALYPERKSGFEANLRAFEHELDGRMFGRQAVERVGGDALWRAALAGRLEGFLAENDAAATLGGWAACLRPHRGKTVVTYHRSWTYLAARFGLQADLQLEPKPGIPPTARHLASVVETLRARGARVVLQEPFYTRKAAEYVASRTGATVLVLPTMTGGAPEACGYLTMLDNVITALGRAL